MKSAGSVLADFLGIILYIKNNKISHDILSHFKGDEER